VNIEKNKKYISALSRIRGECCFRLSGIIDIRSTYYTSRYYKRRYYKSTYYKSRYYKSTCKNEAKEKRRGELH